MLSCFIFGWGSLEVCVPLSGSIFKMQGNIFSAVSTSHPRLTKHQILLRRLIVYLHLGWLFNLQRWQLWVEQLCGVSAFIQLHPVPLCPICKLSCEVSLGTYMPEPGPFICLCLAPLWGTTHSLVVLGNNVSDGPPFIHQTCKAFDSAGQQHWK